MDTPCTNNVRMGILTVSYAKCMGTLGTYNVRMRIAAVSFTNCTGTPGIYNLRWGRNNDFHVCKMYGYSGHTQRCTNRNKQELSDTQNV